MITKKAVTNTAQHIYDSMLIRTDYEADEMVWYRAGYKQALDAMCKGLHAPLYNVREVPHEQENRM